MKAKINLSDFFHGFNTVEIACKSDFDYVKDLCDRIGVKINPKSYAEYLQIVRFNCGLKGHEMGYGDPFFLEADNYGGTTFYMFFQYGDMVKWYGKEPIRVEEEAYRKYVRKWKKEHDEGEPACYEEWINNEFILEIK